MKLHYEGGKFIEEFSANRKSLIRVGCMINKNKIKYSCHLKKELGVVTSACNSSTLRLRQEDVVRLRSV